MRKLALILAFGALGLVSALSGAGAQCTAPQAARAQRQIDLTDLRIDQADSRRSAGGDEATALFREANRLQGQAKSELALGRCRSALELTLGARVRALRVLAVGRGQPDLGAPESGRVLNQLDRTQQLIERGRGRMEECADDRARALFRGADEMQQRAEESFHSDRLLAALQLTVAARDRAGRALRLCNRSENPDHGAGQALRRTDEILARAGERSSDAFGVRRALSRARALQDQAYQEFRAGRFEESLRLTQSARAFAQRAIRRSRLNR